MKKSLPASGTNALFIYRGFWQNSLQATVERSPKAKPVIIPRTGSAAPIGSVTLTARKRG
jgi:hypothetical protein